MKLDALGGSCTYASSVVSFQIMMPPVYLFSELTILISHQQIQKTVTLQVSFTPVGECRSADSPDINDKYIRLSAVKMSRFFGKSWKPKVTLW